MPLPPPAADIELNSSTDRTFSPSSSASSIMARLTSWARQTFGPGEPAQYQSLPADENDAAPPSADPPAYKPTRTNAFEYSIFMLLGCAMLWGWNMFLACATYFQGRFASDPFLLNNFQSFILAVSTITNLAAMFYLMQRQAGANYAARIATSLLLNTAVFTLLALSTLVAAAPAPYMAFMLFCVLLSSLSTGFAQNGVFAFVPQFGALSMQAVMAGQGLAGVLPAVAQITSVLLVKPGDGGGATASPKSAFAYFLAATAVSGVCFVGFGALLARHRIPLRQPAAGAAGAPPPHDKSVPLLPLLAKLRFHAFAIWAAFALTLVFPVFTQAIVSVRDPARAGRFFAPDVFIPLGFLVWNAGDFAGRLVCAWPRATVRSGRVLAAAAVARVVFVPLYFMCNIRGGGAVVQSDVFYWAVQLGFGLSNGWVGSCCMMAAPEFVDEEEREACGGFMGLCLVVGLASGSALSFFVL